MKLMRIKLKDVGRHVSRVKEFREDYFHPPRCVSGVGTVWASTLSQEIGHVFQQPQLRSLD